MSDEPVVLHGCDPPCQHDIIATALAAGERDDCPWCGGYGWMAEPHPVTGEPINPQPCQCTAPPPWGPDRTGNP
jgi:hypothetical protein